MAGRRRTRSSSFIRLLAGWGVLCVWAFALALVAWNVLRWYPGDRWVLVRLANYFTPWLMIAACIGLVVAAIGRRRWLTRVLALLCLVFVVRYWPVLVPPFLRSQAVASTSSTQLRVMTFNVHFANRDVQGVARMIRNEAPDIVALQEFTSGLAEPLIPELATDYPYVLLDNAKWPSLGLISRFPLKQLPLPEGAWRTQVARVETPAGPITVYNMHSWPAILQPGWQRQRETFTIIAQQVASANGPVLVLGDFNTTDQNENYRLIAEHLTDVYRAVGWGFGFTFPGRRLEQGVPPLPSPVLRIDYIFVSDQWTPQAIRVLPVGPGSDHLPVIATLRLAD